MTGGEQDVGRLDVAVDDVVSVRVGEGVRDFAGDPQGIGQRKLLFSSQAVSQRLALDEGHDVVEQAVGRAGVVQRQDVGVLQPGFDPDLPQESLGAEAGGELGPEHLESHVATMPEIAREIHMRHPPVTELAADRIMFGQRGLQPD